MPRRIVLLGATGQTGRLVAAALMNARVRPVLVGRNAQSLAALGVRLGHGLTTVTLDLAEPDGLHGVLRKGDVVINTVGPFARFGRAVIEATIRRRAVYIDCAAEPDFLLGVFRDFDAIASQVGTALIPGFGHEYVAGNVAACLALEGLEEATRVDVGYFETTARDPTPGRRMSRVEAAMAPHYMWQGGRLIRTSFGHSMRTFVVGGSHRPSLASGGSEHISIPRLHESILDVGVYVGINGSVRSARWAASVVRQACRIRAVPPMVRWMALPRTTEGFGVDIAARPDSTVVAVASTSHGRGLRCVTLSGASPRAFTAEILAWAAQEAAVHGVRGDGALGPVEAFGLSALRDACGRLAMLSYEPAVLEMTPA